MQQLGAIHAMSPKTGKFVNVDRMKQFYQIYQTLEIFRSISYTFDYDEQCGGYLYNATVWKQEKIDYVVSEIPSVEEPVVRPEFEDIRNPEEAFQEISDDDSDVCFLFFLIFDFFFSYIQSCIGFYEF